ncbi:MAG TPA: hypothetical protein VML75_06355 [Kofleriaceae bacterium]|nr:hypothetical protein [Kofleriaceae bacterium]
MKQQLAISSLMTLSITLGAACASRTVAATQPTPVAFDATASEPKAIATVDAMTTAVGGAEAWDKVKQISWEHRYTLDGEEKSHVVHAWDMWNGRHRCEMADMSSGKVTVDNPNPGPLSYSVAMYDLFDVDSTSGHATYGGKEVDSGTRRKIKASCNQVFAQDSYQLTMHFKLKDPGVKLESAGQMKDVARKDGGTMCAPACDSVKVTFDPAVGKDTWWIHVNTETHMPEFIEKQVQGGRLAFILGDWITVGGLKFPQQLQNAGLTGEIFKISKIQVGDPDDRLYIPEVR